MKQALFVGVEVTFRNTTYFMSGEYSEDKIILSCSVQQVDQLLTDIIGANNSLYQFVQPLLPHEIQFVYTINKQAANSFHLEAEFGNGLIEIRIIKDEKFSMFELWINHAIQLNGLPLVGSFITEGYKINKTAYIYLNKNDNSEVLISSYFEPYKNKKSNFEHIDLCYNQQHNVLMECMIGDKLSLIAFPTDTIQQVDLEQTNTTTSLQSIETEPNQELKKKNFSIDKLALQFDAQRKFIQLYISAHLYLSKFQLDVIGLKFNYDVQTLLQIMQMLSKSEADINWSSEIIKGLSFEVEGLALNYHTTNFAIVGGFYKTTTANETEYNGLVSFKFKKIELSILGSYIKQEQFSSVFAFGYIAAPFGGIPAFELKGIGLGFGLNRKFQLPSIKQIKSFPLIQLVQNNGPTPNQSIQDFFGQLNGYFQPKQDAYVIVLGIRFQTFKIIDTIALASVIIDQGCKISLIGVSSMESAKAYRLIIPFSLTLDLEQGEILARGEIDEGSYLLFPELSLSGSFAFGMWLQGDHAGDFVISLGGYHPDFKAKSHYPKANELNRLTLHYKNGPLQILGAIYFTLTSQAIMCGVIGQLFFNYSLQVGVRVFGVLVGFSIAVEVIIRLEANFLISWKPFFYKAELNLLFSISLRANFTLFKVNINVQLAAGLSIWGPEFAGKAYIKVCSYLVEVKFGNHTSRSTKLTKAEFVNSYLPDSPIQSAITAGVLHKFKLPTGQERIVVSAQDWAMEVTSKIPLKTIRSSNQVLHQSTVAFDANFDKTNDASPLQSILKIELYDQNNQLIPVQQLLTVEPLKSNFPKALWSPTELTTHSILKEDNLIKNVLSGIKIEFKKTPTTPTNGQVDSTIEQYYKSQMLDQAPIYTADQQLKPSKSIKQLRLHFQQNLQQHFTDLDIDYTDLMQDTIAYTYRHDIHIYDIN